MGIRGIRLVLLTALLCAGASEAWAQGITATVDRREVTMQDQIVLQVTIEGSRGAQPRLPEMPDFDVFQRGQSSQVQIINGSATSSVVYNYLLAPKRTGSFSIGPATVDIDGATYSSRPFTLRVLEASAKPQDSLDAFVRVSVSTDSPFVGQQVIFVWRFFRRVQLAGANLESLDFPGFLVDDLGEVREYQSVVEGQTYVVNEFRKALFPQEEGALTIPPSVLNCQVVIGNRRAQGGFFNDFFGRTQTQSKLLRSKPIELEVRPLPPAPADFSGLVGRFELSSNLSKHNIQVGESTTLSLSVSGTGNVRSISEPNIPELPSFKIYDDKPSISVDTKGDALTGRTTFTKALVPLTAGQLSIPAMTLTYFDPGEGRYRTENTGPFDLEVTPADGTEELRLTESFASTTGKVAVRILADDILPIVRGLDAVHPPSLLVRTPASLLGFLLAPPLLFFALLVGERRRQRFSTDTGLKRRKTALRESRRALRRLDGEGADLARRGSRLLRSFVGDKLGLEGAALTPAEVASSLTDANVAEELVARVHRTLNQLEEAQYGAASLDHDDLVTSLDELISALDRGLTGRAR